MNARPARDRLAIWTYEEAGEEIPHGDPSVTDAERSAAGRETIAARWQALLPGNRSRAAAQYAAGGLPEGQEVVRVWQPRDPAELRARLTEPPLVVWAEDSVLHVLWQGHAYEVRLGGGVQPRLWPVAGTGDLWEASLRIRRLEQAVITVMAVPRLTGDDSPPRVPDIRVWRARLFGGRGSGSARSKGPGSLRVSPAARAGRSLLRSAARTCSARWPLQRWRGPATDQPRGPLGQGPALPRGWHARAGLPAGHRAMGRAAAVGRAPVPSRGMDRRPRQPVVGAAVPPRAGLVARTVMSVNSGQSERRLLNVRSAGKPGSSDSGSEAPGSLQGPAAAVVIHISTGPFFHSFTGADLRLCPNCPQIYAQAVIVAGQKAAGEHESREEAVISRDALPPGGPEVTLMRIAC